MQERQEPTNTANEVNSSDKSFVHVRDHLSIAASVASIYRQAFRIGKRS